MKNLYALLDRYNNFFWSKVVASTRPTVASLSFFRIITGLFLLYVFSPFNWLQTVPQAFFTPPAISIASLFSGFPGGGLFVIVDVVLLSSICFITLGVRAKFFSLVYALLTIFALSFQFSFGKIDHSILMIVVVLCMAFSGWGSKLAIWPDKEPDIRTTEKCTSLLAVLICFGFFTAAFGKAFHWINFNPNINGVGSWYYPGYYTLARQYLLAPYFVHVPMVGLKVMDFAAVIFELAPLVFLLWSPKAWRLFLVIAAGFHLVNLVFFNIAFLPNAIAYLAFVNYTAAQNWFRQNVLSNTFLKLSLVCLSLLAVIYTLLTSVLNISGGFEFLIAGDERLTNISLALFVWILSALILFADFVSRRRTSKV